MLPGDGCTKLPRAALHRYFWAWLRSAFLGRKCSSVSAAKGTLAACPHMFEAAKLSGLCFLCSLAVTALTGWYSCVFSSAWLKAGIPSVQGHTERQEDGFLNDDTWKEKYPVLCQISCHFLCKTCKEDSKPKISQASQIPQTDKDSPLNMLNKSVAINMLQEIGRSCSSLLGMRLVSHRDLWKCYPTAGENSLSGLITVNGTRSH